jgi:hypothetical protein
MCVRIHRATTLTAPWDADQLTITIPEWLDHDRALRAVRAILTELGALQPDLGAVCYCGEPVRVETGAAEYMEAIHLGA